MATALDLANRSLKLILVEAADSPLEPDEYQDYYDALNDFMADLEVRGVRLGFTPITGSADEVTVPPGALRGIISNMAIEVAPDYGGKVSPVLVQQAMRGMYALRRIGQVPIHSSYPPTLPFGTGNDDYPSLDLTHYSEDVQGVAWFVANTIPTDITTIGARVRIRGTWVSDGFEAMTFTSSGRFANPLSEQVSVSAKLYITATCAAAVDATLVLMRNGAEEVSTTPVALSTTRADASIDANVTLQPGEYLEAWVSNDTDTTDIVVADARIEID